MTTPLTVTLWQAVKVAGMIALGAGRITHPFPRAELERRFKEATGDVWLERAADFEQGGLRVWVLTSARMLAELDGRCELWRMPGSGPTLASELGDRLGELVRAGRASSQSGRS
jgi:hypothetical protein